MARLAEMSAVRQRFYVGSIVLLALILTAILAAMIDWSGSGRIVAAAWVLGFFLVVLNLSYTFIITTCSLFIKRVILPEVEIQAVPRTAILFVVKNEDDSVFKRMEQTFMGNCDANMDLWLISNSNNPEYIAREISRMTGLAGTHGKDRVFYYQPVDNPTGRKHISIQKWGRDHEEYKYMIVCDADTLLYAGTVRKLLAKAEHPANSDIMMFQAHMEMSESRTRFGRFVEPGQNLVEKVFRRVNFAIFGKSPYYGHSALIRRKEFLALDVPAYVLSHDLWETTAIDLSGSRVALCEDVVCSELFPATYLEDRSRTRRWILGTFEATPLLFRRGLSLGTRFHLFIPLYMYFIQPVFLIWILLGIFAANTLTGTAIAVQPLLVGGGVGLDMEMSGMCLATLSVVWLYRLPYARSWRDFWLLLREILMGTLVIINNIVYVSWYVVASPFLARNWTPMNKRKAEQVAFRDCFRQMLPSTVLGIVLLVFGCIAARAWVVLASPILVSFILGSITVYWTSQPVQSVETGPDIEVNTQAKEVPA